MILRVEHIIKSFNGLKAVNDVSFEISEGTITALIGENGAGKTTLFNVLCGFEKANSGEIIFKGENITAHTALVRASNGIGRLFQQPHIFKDITVFENLLASTKEHPGENVLNYVLHLKNISEKENRNNMKALKILDTIGLKEKTDSKAYELSFGQKKLLSLGMLLMNDARLILLDEPYSGLNPAMISIINGILIDLSVNGICFIIIEHNIKAVKIVSSRVLKMSEGKISEEQTNAALMKLQQEFAGFNDMLLNKPMMYAEYHKETNGLASWIEKYKNIVLSDKYNEQEKLECLHSDFMKYKKQREEELSLIQLVK